MLCKSLNVCVREALNICTRVWTFVHERGRMLCKDLNVCAREVLNICERVWSFVQELKICASIWTFVSERRWTFVKERKVEPLFCPRQVFCVRGSSSFLCERGWTFIREGWNLVFVWEVEHLYEKVGTSFLYDRTEHLHASTFFVWESLNISAWQVKRLFLHERLNVCAWEVGARFFCERGWIFLHKRGWSSLFKTAGIFVHERSTLFFAIEIEPLFLHEWSGTSFLHKRNWIFVCERGRTFFCVSEVKWLFVQEMLNICALGLNHFFRWENWIFVAKWVESRAWEAGLVYLIHITYWTDLM